MFLHDCQVSIKYLCSEETAGKVEDVEITGMFLAAVCTCTFHLYFYCLIFDYNSNNNDNTFYFEGWWGGGLCIVSELHTL